MIVITGGRGFNVSVSSSISLITSSTSESETRTTLCPNSSMISSAVSASIVWFCVTIIPIFIRDFTTSAERSAMRLANSDTVIASGSCTSRTIFSRSALVPIAFCRARSCLRRIAAIDFCRPPSPSKACDRVSLPERRPSSRPLLLRRSCSVSRSFLREVGAADFNVGRLTSPSFLTAGAATADFASAAAFFAESSRSLRRRVSSSVFLRAISSASRCSRSFSACSARRRSRSFWRFSSSAARVALSSASRALAACTAFKRRAISVSEMPAGRLLDCVFAGFVPGCTGVPAFGTTTRLRLVSTKTFLVLPWLKLCFTFPERGVPRKPKVFLPSLSLI